MFYYQDTDMKATLVFGSFGADICQQILHAFEKFLAHHQETPTLARQVDVEFPAACTSKSTHCSRMHIVP